MNLIELLINLVFLIKNFPFSFFDIMKSSRVEEIRNKVYKSFDESLPVLMDILRIPSMSREFDSQYLTNGLLLNTAESFEKYIR